MEKKIKFLVGLFIIAGIFCVPSFSFSESDISIYESDISVTTWPEIPEPYKEVQITLSSYATDLTKARFEWLVGGEVVLSGFGKNVYSFTAPGPNTTTNINIAITPANSLTKLTKNITLRPSEIEVVWEAVDGYTPPFYKGKSLVSQEGTIKVVAIPVSSTIKRGGGDVSYRWKRDDDTVQEASGYNKTSYTFTNNAYTETEHISLAASSVDGSYVAGKNIEIPIYNPKVLFYKKSPTEGVLYNKALVNNSLFAEDEITIVAEPYFLAIKDSWSNFKYRWGVNGNDINTPDKKNEITLRPVSRGGYADISISFEHINKLFQGVTGYLKLSL